MLNILQDRPRWGILSHVNIAGTNFNEVTNFILLYNLLNAIQNFWRIWLGQHSSKDTWRLICKAYVLNKNYKLKPEYNVEMRKAPYTQFILRILLYVISVDNFCVNLCASLKRCLKTKSRRNIQCVHRVSPS